MSGVNQHFLFGQFRALSYRYTVLFISITSGWTLVGDNVAAFGQRRHESADRSKFLYLMYNTVMYRNRIDVSHLSATPPTVDLASLDYTQFIPSVDEQEEFIKSAKVNSGLCAQYVSAVNLGEHIFCTL